VSGFGLCIGSNERFRYAGANLSAFAIDAIAHDVVALAQCLATYELTSHAE